LALLVAATSISTLLFASVSSASARTAVLTCGSSRVVRPLRYELGCGSGTYVVTNIHWRAWGTNVASGSGTYVTNDCTPTCASGRDVKIHATVTLSNESSTPHGPVFRRAVIHFVKDGHPKSSSWALPPFA
jgi:hypothetical protein